MPSESRQQLQTIWAYRFWLGLFVAVVTIAAYLAAKRETPSYKATALVQVTPGAEASGQFLPADAQQSLVNIYVRYAQTPAVYELAARVAGLGSSPSAIEGHLAVNPEPGSTVLALSATYSSPAAAARSANAYASALATFVQQYESSQSRQTLGRIQSQIEQTTSAASASGIAPLEAAQLSSEVSALRDKLASTVAAPTDSVQLLGRASIPSAPTSPKPTRNAILAFLVALVLGGAAILGFATVSDRYRDADEVSADLGLQLLGEMPRAPASEQAAIEAFRRLRTTVLLALGAARQRAAVAERPAGARDSLSQQGSRRSTILVTAADQAVGKSYISAGLARALSADGWGVLAIDGDLRRPTLDQQLQVAAAPGLSELLSGGDRDLLEVCQSAPEITGPQPGTLNVLAAGRAGSDTTERLASPEMRGVFDKAREVYDYVVLDSSPILPVVDAIVLARYAQGVVLVVDARHSRRREVRQAVKTLKTADAPLLGFVYNRSKATVGAYGYSQVVAGDQPADAAELVH